MAENPEQIHEDLVLVRDIMARELETVNTYFALMQRARNEKIRSFIEHVMNEEKEHISESLHLLREFDSVQALTLDTRHAPENASPDSLQPPQSQETSPLPTAESTEASSRETVSERAPWSVGSLYGVAQE